MKDAGKSKEGSASGSEAAADKRISRGIKNSGELGGTESRQKENRRGEEKKAYTERLSRVDGCRAEGADRGKRSREELDRDRGGIRSDGDRRTDTDVARKEGRAMTVRCIYGGTVQEASEKAGMKGWCDKHCRVLGMERGHICYAALKKAGINPEEEHKK